MQPLETPGITSTQASQATSGRMRRFAQLHVLSGHETGEITRIFDRLRVVVGVEQDGYNDTHHVSGERS